MCGRYSLEPWDSAEVEKIIKEVQDKIKTGEIYPTNIVPVLTGPDKVEAVKWGFLGFKGNQTIINARAETAADKRIFSKPLMDKRCVVPSTGFFEWQDTGTKKKQKYKFSLPGQTALYLAGLYNDFQGERRVVILTTGANASMEEVHNRMPVVLQKDEVSAWIQDGDRTSDLLSRVPPELSREAVQ